MLSRRVNATEELHANSLTMSRFDLSIPFCSCISSCFFICLLLYNVVMILFCVVIVVWEVSLLLNLYNACCLQFSLCKLSSMAIASHMLLAGCIGCNGSSKRMSEH